MQDSKGEGTRKREKNLMSGSEMRLKCGGQCRGRGCPVAALLLFLGGQSLG